MLASLTVFYLPAKTLPKSSLTSNGVALPVRRAAPAIRARPAPAVTFFLTLFTFATLDLHARPTPSSNLWHNQADLVDHRSWHPAHSPSPFSLMATRHHRRPRAGARTPRARHSPL